MLWSVFRVVCDRSSVAGRVEEVFLIHTEIKSKSFHIHTARFAVLTELAALATVVARRLCNRPLVCVWVINTSTCDFGRILKSKCYRWRRCRWSSFGQTIILLIVSAKSYNVDWVDQSRVIVAVSTYKRHTIAINVKVLPIADKNRVCHFICSHNICYDVCIMSVCQNVYKAKSSVGHLRAIRIVDQLVIVTCTESLHSCCQHCCIVVSKIKFMSFNFVYLNQLT